MQQQIHSRFLKIYVVKRMCEFFFRCFKMLNNCSYKTGSLCGLAKKTACLAFSPTHLCPTSTCTSFNMASLAKKKKIKVK